MTQYIKKWSGIMKKASPEILYISKQQGLGFPDLTSQSQLTRADILSTSVDPLIKKLANRNHGNWLVGVPSSIETDLSAYSRRRLKIGKLSRNTREHVY
jgi:hypothetical protein